MRSFSAGMKLSAMWVAAALLAAAQANAAAPADYVFQHGYIYTVDNKDSVQQAVAVRGGRIVYVGNDAGAGSYVGPRTVSIDLKGRMLMPGLVDGHVHPVGGGG
jgi:predicted amidohydrolase YtcJ